MLNKETSRWGAGRHLATWGMGVCSLLAVVTTTTGCNMANTVQPAGGRAVEPIEDERVTWDWGLNWKTHVVGLYPSKKEGELMRVGFEISSRSTKPRAFRYRFEWFDADGNLVPTLQTWQDATIAAGAQQRYVGIAPTLKAVDFRLALTEKQ